MANTVDLEKITEYDRTNDAETTAMVAELATLIKNAKHVIIFTGAGISVSAKIADFRGPNGVWTRQAQGLPPPESISLKQAVPTPCHRLIKDLVDCGACKYIVSQNIDGLHRASGVPRDAISELHGNCFLEVCWSCGADREHVDEVEGGLRKPKSCTECLKRVPHFCHCTRNKCVACGARMKDSIIHFGENLPEVALQRAFNAAKAADLCIVLGSSLTVSPACDIPRRVARKTGGKLAIVNLQETPLDDLACLRLWAKTDAVAEALRSYLCESGVLAKEREAEAAAAPPTISARIDHDRLEIGNLHRTVAAEGEGDGNVHEWTMFVRAPPRRPLKCVVYRLHPTFTPSNIVVQSTQENPECRLSRVGWGTFAVGVQVMFADGAVQIVSHDLCFSSDVSSIEVACK